MGLIQLTHSDKLFITKHLQVCHERVKILLQQIT